jgi:FxsC-like protein
MTPRYFRSEPCGREWQLFADRQARYEASASVESSLLKPLMWVPTPPAKMHPAAMSLQHHSAHLGPVYQRLGVRQLMRLHRHQDDYRSLVFELAGQIVEGVERHRIPPGRRAADFNGARNAFRMARDVTSATLAMDGRHRAAPLTQPLLVHLVVAAASRVEMAVAREDLSAYGDRPLEWAPYRPPLPVALAEYACDIAADHEFESRVAELPELANRAELASRYNQIVVLLLDAWGTRLEETHRALSAHNARAGQDPPATTAVLIPNSRDDAETRRTWPELSRSCREVLHQLAHDDELYRSAIPTHRAFEGELSGVLEVARNRVYRTGRVHRPPDHDVSTEPPRIDGLEADPVEEEQP